MKYLVRIKNCDSMWNPYKDIFLDSPPEVMGFFKALLHGEPTCISRPVITSTFDLDHGYIKYSSKENNTQAITFSICVYKIEDFMYGSTCHNFLQYPYEGIFKSIESYNSLTQVFPKLDKNYSEPYMEPYQLNKELTRIAKEFNKEVTK